VCALNADFFSFQVFFPKNERDFEHTLDQVLDEYANFADMDDQDAVAERKVCFISVVFLFLTCISGPDSLLAGVPHICVPTRLQHVRFFSNVFSFLIL
jgi:hypothetical protein